MEGVCRAPRPGRGPYKRLIRVRATDGMGRGSANPEISSPGVVGLSTLRIRARTKWTVFLVYILTVSLGYGGLSVCVAAHGELGAGYSYCCRYWCGADSPSSERTHFDRCAPSSSGWEQGSEDTHSCRDYSFFVIPRGRGAGVQHGSALKAVDGPCLAERPAPSLVHEVACTTHPPWLYQPFHPIIHDPLSVILLL